MKLNYKFISLLIILFFLSVSIASAADNNNETIQMNDEPTTDLQSVGDTDIIAKDTSNDNLAEVILDAENLTKYFHGPEKLEVSVKGKGGDPLENKTLKITINGVTYNKTTNNNGIASIAINLGEGNYTIPIIFPGDFRHPFAKTIAYVTIKSTIVSSDLTKIDKATEAFTATVLDSNGQVLPKGEKVKFNINGVFYIREVKDGGKASLNINLDPGIYTITTYNSKTGEEKGNKVIVKHRLLSKDTELFYRNGSSYEVTVLDDNGKAVGAGETVTFNINGVMYKRETDANGVARLKINLDPETYTITATYKNSFVSNKVIVLPVIVAIDLIKKHGEAKAFEALLLDSKGKPLANEILTFNINGVFYNRATDNLGVARLNINLDAGAYIITTTYNVTGASRSNLVTVLPL